MALTDKQIADIDHALAEANRLRGIPRKGIGIGIAGPHPGHAIDVNIEWWGPAFDDLTPAERNKIRDAATNLNLVVSDVLVGYGPAQAEPKRTKGSKS